MKTLKHRIEATEATPLTGLCYDCSLRRLSGDSTIGDTCPHPDCITYGGEALWREVNGATSEGQILTGTSGLQRR